VTFRVDMSEQVVAGGVFLHAAFDGWGSIEMSDIDGDNVYETTQNLTSGSYEFRYQNGEGMSEVFNAENFTVPRGFGRRWRHRHQRLVAIAFILWNDV